MKRQEVALFDLNDYFWRAIKKGKIMPIAYIGVGSNIGNKIDYIKQACSLLSQSKRILSIESSSLYETEPYGYKDQDWFINAVFRLETELLPHDLLKECNRIENLLGRIRNNEIPKWRARTLDLDILFYDDLFMDGENLKIPHPEVHKRAFTLIPLVEIAPELKHPTLNKTLKELYKKLQNPESVHVYGKINENEIKNLTINN